MQIAQKLEGNKITVSVVGRLDTVTAPDLQKHLAALPAAATEIMLDFAKLDYISSAGLRVLLTAHKAAVAAGSSFAIAGSNDAVKDVFEMTGFSDILNLV